jgi:hypothetical protein
MKTLEKCFDLLKEERSAKVAGANRNSPLLLIEIPHFDQTNLIKLNT